MARKGRRSGAVAVPGPGWVAAAMAVIGRAEAARSGEAGVLACDARIAARWRRSAAFVRRYRSRSFAVREIDPEIFPVIVRDLAAAAESIPVPARSGRYRS